jgi:hypothetical protein
LAGWPPPGPPRFLSGFPELRRRRRILSVPPAADRGPRGSISIVTSTGLLAPRLPPRPMASRTGFSPTSKLSPDTADGSPRSTATGHKDPDLPPPGTADGSPRSAATGRNNRCTRPVPPRRLLGRRGSRHRALYLPVLPRRDRLLRGRFPGQNASCTPPGSSHDAGPPRLPHSASCTAPPGPSRPIRPRRRPGDSPDLPATYGLPFRPSSRSRSR